MRSSPTSRADRANSPPPEGTEGTGWHDLYVNEHWPVYDAQRKAIMFKAKAFNAGFAQAHGLRHMLSSDRDIEAVCEMVRGALQRVVGTWGWSMLRVRYMLQCNRRLQRFLTRLRQRHDTFVGNMFAHWCARVAVRADSGGGGGGAGRSPYSVSVAQRGGGLRGPARSCCPQCDELRHKMPSLHQGCP